MTEGELEEASAVFEDSLETADDEIEELATSGGITADTRETCRSIRCYASRGGGPSRVLSSTVTGPTSSTL